MGLKRQIQLQEVIKNDKKCRNDWSQSSQPGTSAGRVPDLQAGYCGFKFCIRHTFTSLIHFNGDEVLVSVEKS